MQDRLRAGVEFKLENVKLHFRRTSVVLLATASLMCSLPAWSQNATLTVADLDRGDLLFGHYRDSEPRSQSWSWSRGCRVPWP